MTKRQMINLSEINIQLLRLTVCEMNRTYSAKRSGKLPKVCFYRMNIFEHKPNDIDWFIGIISDKIFSGSIFAVEKSISYIEMP